MFIRIVDFMKDVDARTQDGRVSVADARDAAIAALDWSDLLALRDACNALTGTLQVRAQTWDVRKGRALEVEDSVDRGERGTGVQ